MSQVRRPEQLSIGFDTTDSDLELFIDTWTWYKDMCRLRDLAVIWNELKMACNSDVNRLLFDLIEPEILNSAMEEYLLHQIWFITVQGLHKEVHWQNFYLMRQKECESVSHFLARLRAQAKFCEFRVVCPNEMNCGWQVDYSNDMVAGQMVAGLANMEHQSRVLVESITLTTLEQKFNC